MASWTSKINFMDTPKRTITIKPPEDCAKSAEFWSAIAMPRTDAILLPIYSHSLPDDVVYADEMRLLERELSAATDTLDLMRDEFQRIKSCPGCDSEIAQLCDRAQLNLLQRVPVIAQRDRAGDRLRVAKTALHIIANIWQTQSEACADNSRAGELMAEQARKAIAKLTP